MNKVPEAVVNAVNLLLAPYGECYDRSGQPARGYRNTKEACAYLGVSRSFLYKLVREGRVHPIKLNSAAVNGMVVYSVDDLDVYVASCRTPQKIV